MLIGKVLTGLLSTKDSSVNRRNVEGILLLDAAAKGLLLER